MKTDVCGKLPRSRVRVVLLSFAILFASVFMTVIADAEAAVQDSDLITTEVPVVRINSEAGEAEEEYDEIQISTENCMAFFRLENVSGEWRIRNAKPSEEPDQRSERTDNKKLTYELKLERRTDFFGMGAARKWVLMANADDVSLIRNSLMCDLSGKLGLLFPLESIWIELYINSEYQGLYQMCEVPDINDERVAVRPAREEFLLDAVTGEDDTPDQVIISPLFRYRFELNSINYLPPDQAEWLQNFLDSAEAALQTGEKDRIEVFFDLPSFAAGLMLYEFSLPEYAGNIPISFIIQSRKIYAGAAWDFEHSCGIWAPNYSGSDSERDLALSDPKGWKEPPPWIREMAQTSWFRALFKEQYMGFQDVICNVYDNNSLGKNQIDSSLSAMPQALSQDQRLYEVNRMQNETSSGQMSRTMHTEALRAWLKARNEWILASLREDVFPETSA